MKNRICVTWVTGEYWGLLFQVGPNNFSSFFLFLLFFKLLLDFQKISRTASLFLMDYAVFILAFWWGKFVFVSS